ncbi:unnamed protein product [Haemonchus placei]|uniref:Reverse transcriptase domain-containing protein n=1 Tax=Haemonchus placei TaxID=6290 RepID=A0A0N4WB47_HAEPC|nr:unnamed protein product [Haemonchus placei]
MKHRFQNKSKKLRAILADYPGFYLQPTFYTKRRRHRMGNTISFGGDLHKGTRPLSHIRCNAECDVGQLFYYKMAANVLIYSKFFIEGAICDWYRGMHKRYGVDPSGMSGGITGSMFGFTTSRVAPSSTIGPTTKGDTTGSTKHWDKGKGTYTYDPSHGSSSRDSSHSSAASHSRSSKRRQSSRSSKSRGSAFDSNVVNL